VVDVGLNLVEILALLLLEPVLTVENKLESVELTGSLLGESHGRTLGRVERGTEGGERNENVGVGGGSLVGLEGDLGNEVLRGEVPERRLGGSVGERPHELLDGVVVGEADLLGTGGVDGVGTGVLNLLDEVLVTLLGKAATLLGVGVGGWVCIRLGVMRAKLAGAVQDRIIASIIGDYTHHPVQFIEDLVEKA